MKTNTRNFRLTLTWLMLLVLLLPIFGAVQVWADPGPILVPVFGDLLPDYTAQNDAYTAPYGYAHYPFDPSGMRTSSFLINTQLHGTGWGQDERLFEAPTGRTQGIYGGLPGVTTNSASIDVANPFLQNVQTSPGWTSLARVDANGGDWPGGSDGTDSFLMDIIVQTEGGKSWQEANAHLHARYSIDDPGWTFGHNVTLTADFTPDVDWTGAVANRDVRVVFGWALGPVVDFYHDWGPREDSDQLNDLLTAHYDAIAAGDGDAFYYSYIFPFTTPTAQSDVLTLFVDYGETFDIDAFLRGHITNNYSSPRSNGTIELTVSVERGEAPPAREIKEGVRDSLEALLPTGDSKTDKAINKAIASINKSLDLELWESDWTLDPKHGKKVFDEEKKGVKELMKVVSPDVSGAINSLVFVDQTLAQTAIDEAIAASGDPKDIAKAQEEMVKALEEIGKGKYDKAIDHYKKAWEKAQKAMK